MPDKRPVALALLTQTQLDMLRPALKQVFRIEDSGEQFVELLHALDRSDILAALARSA
jgi:hypothetical protein